MSSAYLTTRTMQIHRMLAAVLRYGASGTIARVCPLMVKVVQVDLNAIAV